MRRKSPCLRIWVLAGGAAAALLTPPGFADVKQVRLGVKGATCATWAFALRKGFQRLDGVEEAKLVIKPAHMQIRVKPAQWPDLSRMQKTIREAGFVPVSSHVELVLTGELRKEGERVVVVLDGMSASTSLPLAEAEGAPIKSSVLEQHLGQVVELVGRWQPPANGETGAGTLSVLSLQAMREK